MSQWLRKRGKVWHYRFNHGGIDYSGSTRATDYSTAKLVMEEARRQAILLGIGHGKAPSLGAVAKAWMKAKTGQASAAHLKNAGDAMEALAPLLKMPCDRITDAVFQQWRGEYLQTHARSTTNLATKYLKIWLRSALKDRGIREMPCDLTPLKEQERSRPIVADWKAFVALASAGARSPQIRPAIIMCVMLGLRISELVQARWEWIEDGTFIVGGRTKSKRIRRVPIPAVVMQELTAYAGGKLPDLGLIFPGRSGRHATTWLRRYLAKGGLPGVHRLRATFATLLLRAKTNPKDVQEMLGHAHITTTMKYSEGSLENKRKAQDELWA